MVCLLNGAVGAFVCKCACDVLVCVRTVVETGVFETVVCKCAFEAFEYVRAAAETGAFEAIVFVCAFETAFQAFACMRATVHLRC